MTKEISMGAYVLAAGLQTRFNGPGSKLMSTVDGRPAFSYTMEALLEIFPEESICVVTSNAFEDFNTFVAEELPCVDLRIDDVPGSGSARSLQLSYPWRQEWGFVTEANIFYNSDLIKQSLEILAHSQEALGIISVTKHVDVAKTHRPVRLSPCLAIAGKSDSEKVQYRNVGAYILNARFEQYSRMANDIIDIIHIMNLVGEFFAPNMYDGDYLHIEDQQDVEYWRHHFRVLKNEKQ